MSRRAVAWYGGGYDYNEPPPPPGDEVAVPGRKIEGGYGPAAERVGFGLVAGRFSPLHRGHQLVIEVALRTASKVIVAIAGRAGDEVPLALRAAWIRALYPTVQIETFEDAEPFPAVPARLQELLRKMSAAPHVFASEPAHRALAEAVAGTLVLVDPARAVIPISGSALRSSLLNHFAYVAPSARPALVRRIAVVGAESTGKTTLCTRLREELGAQIVPEYLATFLEAKRRGTVESEELQAVARAQAATEDALAAQATSGLLVADTELHTLHLWGKRLFEGEPPAWIADQIRARAYDLVLVCSPDIPYHGHPDWDRPVERRKFHADLVASLVSRKAAYVELRGGREECFEAAADAIIALYDAAPLLAARAR